MRIHASRARAFTLMEVLIAVVAFAIVLSAIGTVFFGALRLHTQTHESLAQALPQLHALAVLKRDLVNLVPPGGALTGPLESATGTGESSPEFYTTTGIQSDFAPWPEIQQVRYLLAQSTNQFAGKDLYRAVRRNLLASSEEESVYQWLLGGVDELLFEFHDGTQWRDSWDSTTEDVPMPKGIRVQIILANTNRAFIQPPLELVVPVTVQARTNQTEEASQP